MIIQNPNVSEAEQKAVLDKLLNDANIDKNREEWFEVRRGRITASSAWKLLTPNYRLANNETRKKYLLEKAAERLGSRLEQWETAATAWGKERESEAIEEYEFLKKNAVIRPQGIESFETMNSNAGATPDGYVLKMGLLEVKCPYNPAEHVRHLMIEDQFDMKLKLHKYFCQVQFQLLVCNKQWVDFVSFDPRLRGVNRVKVVRVRRDLDVIALLRKAVKLADVEVEGILDRINGVGVEEVRLAG
jgi:hypothetical protein